MTNAPKNSLTPQKIAVLRAVSRMDFCTVLSVSTTLGRSAAVDIEALRMLGYISVVSSPRKDGSPSRLNTLTQQGTEALRTHDEPRAAVSGPTIGARPPLNRETYMGSEMQPYTGRAGSMDALKYPSRVGDELRYRDTPVTPTEKKARPEKSKTTKRS